MSAGQSLFAAHGAAVQYEYEYGSQIGSGGGGQSSPGSHAGAVIPPHTSEVCVTQTLPAPHSASLLHSCADARAAPATLIKTATAVPSETRRGNAFIE
jgi:hypothetical protein